MIFLPFDIYFPNFGLAVLQLDVIGVSVGHLPSKPPFSATPISKTTQVPSDLQISNAVILSAIKNADSFYELYVATTNLAIDMYTQARRRKFALRLHESLAALDV
jgi:trafficking protein particle complex subunit 10